MFIPPVDRTLGEDEWRPFVAAQQFGHLIAPGRQSDDWVWPAIAPTQFVLDGATVLTHLAAPNPVLEALRENPHAVLSVAGDWAFIPAAWKAIGEEDPRLGIPTTYYAAVQIRGRAEVIQEPARIATVLRRQLTEFQPDDDIADPEEAHPAKLKAIRAIILTVDNVVAKFKYGGNVDTAHRLAVADHLEMRNRPGDDAAAAHLKRRLAAGESL